MDNNDYRNYINICVLVVTEMLLGMYSKQKKKKIKMCCFLLLVVININESWINVI